MQSLSKLKELAERKESGLWLAFYLFTVETFAPSLVTVVSSAGHQREGKNETSLWLAGSTKRHILRWNSSISRIVRHLLFLGMLPCALSPHAHARSGRLESVSGVSNDWGSETLAECGGKKLVWAVEADRGGGFEWRSAEETVADD